MASDDAGDDETREEDIDLFEDRPPRPLRRSGDKSGRRSTDIHYTVPATRKTVVVSNVIVAVCVIITEVGPDICFRCIVNL
jgi:hypothetical protein